MDELRQFYELKVYAGAEPDEIRLTYSEVRRAIASTDFFLVVVSGVEEGSADTRSGSLRSLSSSFTRSTTGTCGSGVSERLGASSTSSGRTAIDARPARPLALAVGCVFSRSGLHLGVAVDRLHAPDRCRSRRDTRAASSAP